MKIELTDEYVPGTVKKRNECGGITGGEFLEKIFFVSEGITLAQVREIAGVDGSTLQNWVKRGWLNNTVNKKYSKLHLARILIINMLRKSMMLENIDYLLRYVNGNLDSREDDLMSEPIFYDYICRIIDKIAENGTNDREEIEKTIENALFDYTSKREGGRERVQKALLIITVTYFASVATSYSEKLYNEIKI